MPSYNWIPPWGPTLRPMDKSVVFPAAGGTVIVRTFPDSASGTATRVAFFGIANYNSEPRRVQRRHPDLHLDHQRRSRESLLRLHFERRRLAGLPRRHSQRPGADLRQWGRHLRLGRVVIRQRGLQQDRLQLPSGHQRGRVDGLHCGQFQLCERRLPLQCRHRHHDRDQSRPPDRPQERRACPGPRRRHRLADHRARRRRLLRRPRKLVRQQQLPRLDAAFRLHADDHQDPRRLRMGRYAPRSCPPMPSPRTPARRAT